MSKVKLTQNDIYTKEFKKGMSGYNKDEVDVFLDIVIKDYETFNKEIAQLKEENDKLKALLLESKKRIEAVKSTSMSTSAGHAEGTVSLDVLKRISNLEIAVFGGKRNS